MTQWQMINKSEMKKKKPKLQCIWIDKSFLTHISEDTDLWSSGHQLSTCIPVHSFLVCDLCVTFDCTKYNWSSETSDEIFVIREVNYLVFKWAWDLIYNRSFSKKSSIRLFSFFPSFFFGCLAQCLNFLVIRCVLRSSGDNLGHSVFY